MSPNNKNPAAGGGRAPDLFCSAAERSEDSHPPLALQAGSLIGIDPGVVGALALNSRDGDLIEVADMPVLRDGSRGRASVNAPSLAEFLARWHAGSVVCEFVPAAPKEGAAGAFSIGRARGRHRGRARRPGPSYSLP